VVSFRRAVACLLLLAVSSSAYAQTNTLKLEKGDHVSIIGNTTADRLQHHGWLETYIHAMHPELDLTFRNLAVPGDEPKSRPREDNFGSPDQWLTKNETDVVFGFFGYNEAFRGPDGVEGFRKELAECIDGMLAQKYNGESAPRIVMFSPIAHENLNSPHLPNGSKNNVNLHLYTEAMREVCAARNIGFVDLFGPSSELYGNANKPLTMNGIHLLDHGNKSIAAVITKQLFGTAQPKRSLPEVLKLREAVLEKNYHWFSRYRVVDGYNVFGGRSRLAWFDQSNADVMMREMEIFDVMTANRDKRVWAVAKGDDLEVKDDNLPEELVVQTNKRGDLADGSFSYLSAEEGLTKMKLDEGLQANVFASEEMFPELINPVQMAVDTDGRLFASVWPSYPHWNPTTPRRDRILCLPDDNGDGVADRCTVFADELNSVTSFEFWGGGMIVAALPELWFLKDTDGDDKADVKIRILQGLSSADSHHSANAMVVGPDGWLYWSRGIFNVAAMETPTRTYHSGASGVHRFNPRTFEMEFHFPIGPNPHGDFFDKWGFQFANDGTSGTGSYVNIGKGQGNKQWFEKQWRPVSATGSLSSSHFPERHQNNFLICNCIGFLGILQSEVSYDGADITAKAVTPVLDSSDPNFRPTDIEIGGDGALYVSDWANAIIGHMQHNMRDPNRDAKHGRIYRVSAIGRDLLKSVRLKGKPIFEVCDAFYAKENATRYRARLELSGRDSAETVAAVSEWAARRDVSKTDDAQALLECLWVHEEHRVPNAELLKTVLKSAEPRVRAAAIRTLGHWGDQVDGWDAILIAAARDESALVRAEAVKSALSFEGIPAAEVIFEVATQKMDAELDTVLKYAKGQIKVDSLINEAVASGTPLSKAARAYALLNASVSDLMTLDRTEDVYEAILSRSNVNAQQLSDSVNGLAALRKVKPAALLAGLISERDASADTATLGGLGRLLSLQPAADLKSVQHPIETLALKGHSEEGRQLGFASWVVVEGNGAAALYAASKSKASLRDLLAAVPRIPSEELRAGLYGDVRTLMFELPPNLAAEVGSSGMQEAGILVDYFYPSKTDVAVETLQEMMPKASGIVPQIVMEVPQLQQRDQFALRFTGNLSVPKSGKYTFFLSSDDGSRLYLDDKLVINHDGLHGMGVKTGDVQLTAGSHSIILTYFDNGGGDGLDVKWAGPGFDKRDIAAENLSVSGGATTIHDLAIQSLGSIPGNEAELFNDLADLMKAGKYQTSAISVLSNIPEQHWAKVRVPGLVDNTIGYLSAIPAKSRTGGNAIAAVDYVRSLAKSLPEAAAKDALERLQNLDVRVIAIGTVTARMIYDKETIVVQAGKPVEIRFSNMDHMPHNFAIVQPGALQEIGELAEATARDADAKQRHYVPKSDKVILASNLLEPGKTQALSFEAPTTPGVYPYVCTYPGHWRRMFGAMYVVEDLETYSTDPSAYMAANPLEVQDEMLSLLGRNTEWKLADLADDVMHVEHRSNSFEVGEKLFNVASCIGCHKMNGKGANVGPDLTQLPKEYTPTDILLHMLEPSKKIDRKYQSNIFEMVSGKTIAGLIVKEDETTVHVVDNPTAPDKVRVIPKDDIDDRSVSPVSIMPQGVLNKLTKEEILDLLAYVVAKGDRKNPIFAEHHH
jgi:putative heme-binding domain-containing protein